ncbi:MAG: GIY-YIG nuclease family protein [Candidatus Paceibacterota bacterium]
MCYYVYVLRSLKDGCFYIGFTNNLKRRFSQHNSGQVKSTKSRRPFKIMYYEAHTSKKDAKRREQYFKSTKGKSTLRQMLRNALDQK